MSSPAPQFPVSILDTDLYKLTMQAAILQLFPEAQVTYTFTNRSKDMLFTRDAVEWIQASVNRFEDLKLTPEEKSWLGTTCHYFPAGYLDWLEQFRFHPSQQITLEFEPKPDSEFGDIRVGIRGAWKEVILYEVPLLALISEAYFRFVETEWSYAGQIDGAYNKAKRLLEAGAAFSEFGTRRRRSYHGQYLVMSGIMKARQEFPEASGTLTGTSNVHFARMFGVNPVGTQAHEFFMGIAALKGYEHANGLALDYWDQVYPNSVLAVALTDTFAIGPFFEDFTSDAARAAKWKALRQDSGDPFRFIPVAKKAFETVGLDPKTRSIVFSDGLDVEKAVKLLEACREAGIGASFGIGTSFTNDYVKAPGKEMDESGDGPEMHGDRSKALNIVIKLSTIDGKDAVKISDDVSKNTGKACEVARVKALLQLE